MLRGTPLIHLRLPAAPRAHRAPLLLRARSAYTLNDHGQFSPPLSELGTKLSIIMHEFRRNTVSYPLACKAHFYLNFRSSKLWVRLTLSHKVKK